jgi:hypothetical protein
MELCNFKIDNVYLRNCFERIEKHVARPKCAQNLQKERLNNVAQKTCMFPKFLLVGTRDLRTL